MRLTGIVLSCAVVAACCLGLTQPALAQQKSTKTVTTSPLSIDLASQPLVQSGLVSAARRSVQTLPMTITLSTVSLGAPNTLSAAPSAAAGPKRSAITTAQLMLNLGPSVTIPGGVINAPKRSVATSPLVIDLSSTPGSAAAGKLARTITASPLVINLATIAAAPPSSSKRAITTGALAITLTR